MSKLTTGHKEKLFSQLQRMCVSIFPSPKTLFYSLSSVSAISCCTCGQGCHCLVFTASATIHILRLMSQICFPLFNLHQSTRCYLLFSMVVWTTLPPPPGRHWRPMSSRLSSKVTNCLPALYHRRLLPPFSKTIRKQAIFLLGIFYHLCLYWFEKEFENYWSISYNHINASFYILGNWTKRTLLF